MTAQIGFGVIAVCLLLSALFVVGSKNLVHAVLWLAVTLLSTAVLFVTMQAPFVAGIQVLLYAGGVITLMLFGVMLTRRHERVEIDAETSPRRRVPAAIAGTGMFILFATALSRTPEQPLQPHATVDTVDIGRSFLTGNVLAFEVLSVLLLAAMIGAIVVARRRDHGFDHVRIPRKREQRG
jgi:NADH-quinone oxidoreductase subunit J